MSTRRERLIAFIGAIIDETREELAFYEEIGERIGSKKRISRAKTSKACCTKSEVTSVVAGLLSDKGMLSRAELEELAKDKLSNQLGKSLSGFAMRFKEALGDAQFIEITPGTFQLTQAS